MLPGPIPFVLENPDLFLSERLLLCLTILSGRKRERRRDRAYYVAGLFRATLDTIIHLIVTTGS